MRTFKLTPEDINMLNEDLRNALIPFEQVKITGDLGEGIILRFNHNIIIIPILFIVDENLSIYMYNAYIAFVNIWYYHNCI